VLSRHGDHERGADTVASVISGTPPASAGHGGAADRVPSQGAASRRLGAGQPLPASVRGPFEAALGAGLGRVRLHTGAAAAEAARSARARAFTAGSDIAIGAGQYRPDTRVGRRLLAHEVAHTVQHEQQGVTPGEPVRRIPMDSPTWGLPRTPAPTDRELVDAALASRAVSDVKLIRNFGAATETERLTLIGILLDQFWVGPADEYALERAWASFGDRLIEVGEANVGLWNQSVERGAELTSLPPVAAFIANFQQRARTVTEEILESSEERINTERVRYGLSRVDTTTDYDTPHGTRYHTESTYSMARSESTFGLAEAARQLAAKRRQISDLTSEQSRLVRRVFNRQMGEEYETITDQSRYDSLTTQIRQAQGDFQILRATHESSFPILATYAEDVSSLERIAEGPSAGAAEVLESTTREKLSNIATVRRRLDGETSVVWKLPPVLAVTKQQLGIGDGTFSAGMVNAQVDKVQTDELLKNLALGAIALGLGLLAAVPTGGGSLVAAGAATVGAVGSVAVSAYTVGEHLREYQFQAAAAGSDFDKARAVSGEDPSLFWLALDIIGLGLDLGAAVGVFRALAAPARAAAAAGASDDALEALAVAARGQGEQGAVLSERVAASARRLRGAGSVEEAVGAPGAAASVRRVAARAAEEVLERTAVQGKAAAAFGHEVRAAGGALWRCSPTCTQLRELFATQLAGNPSLEQRLVALEMRAGAAATDDAARAVAREAAALEAELRRLVPHIPGSALRPGFNAGELVGEVAAATGKSAGEIEALFRLASQLSDGEMASLRRIVDEFSAGRGLSDDAARELGRLSERVLTRSEEAAAAGRGALVHRDPFTGEPLLAGTDAHRRQRWFEYQQLHRDRFPAHAGDIDPAWSRQYDTILENSRAGRGFEDEALGVLGYPKNNDMLFMNPEAASGRGFIPDGVLSGPRPPRWGEPYHFVEVKGWDDMSNTGNLNSMLDYVEQFGGHIEVVLRSEAHARGATRLSGPLERRLEALIREGRATVRRFPPTAASGPGL
jgi:hypothetical protein